MNTLFSLDNKKILITGASRGIGFLLARGLAQYGAHILVNATTQENASVRLKHCAVKGSAPMRRLSTSPTHRLFMPR